MKQKLRTLFFLTLGSFMGYCIWFTLATQIGII